MFLFVVTEAGEKSAAVTNVPAEGSREKAGEEEEKTGFVVGGIVVVLIVFFVGVGFDDGGRGGRWS